MVHTHDPEPVWDKEVDLPEKWIQCVDSNVATSKSFFPSSAAVRSDIKRTARGVASHRYISVRV